MAKTPLKFLFHGFSAVNVEFFSAKSKPCLCLYRAYNFPAYGAYHLYFGQSYNKDTLRFEWRDPKHLRRKFMPNYDQNRKPSKDDKQRDASKDKDREKKEAEQKRLKEAQAKGGKR